MPSELDEEFSKYLQNIFSFAGNCSDSTLLDHWTQRLLNSGDTPDLCKIRNEYASLLLHMLQQNKQLGPPFNRSPPPDHQPLPSLSNFSPNAGSSKSYSPSSSSSPGKFTPRPGTPRNETTYNVSDGTYATHSRMVSDSGHSIVIEDLHVSVPTGGEMSEESNELCDLVARMPQSMNVYQFVAAVSPLLEDKGEGLNTFLAEELNQFRTFVSDMFDSKNQYYGDMMARHETSTKKQFTKWIRRLNYFLKDNRNFLQEYGPECNPADFAKNPKMFDEYFAQQLITDAGEVYAEEGSSSRWRAKNFHKLLLLRSETKGVQECNEDLRKKLDSLQRKYHDDQTYITMNEQMKHEKTSALHAQLREERDKQNKYDDQITSLLEKMGMVRAS